MCSSTEQHEKLSNILTVKMAVLYLLLSPPVTLTDFNCFKRQTMLILQKHIQKLNLYAFLLNEHEEEDICVLV
jgi:hypothetical protein